MKNDRTGKKRSVSSFIFIIFTGIAAIIAIVGWGSISDIVDWVKFDGDEIIRKNAVLLIGTSWIFVAIIAYLLTRCITKRQHNSPNLIYRNLGIKGIYEKAAKRQIGNEIASAKKISLICYYGLSFADHHKRELISALDNGASIRLLLLKKNSEFANDLIKTENLDMNKINSGIDSVIHLYKTFKDEQKDRSLGSIEIREFNTEFRNPITIIRNRNEVDTAFLSIIHSHKSAATCIHIEFQGGSEVGECIKYFEKIWSLHENDVLYSSLKRELSRI